MRFRRRLNVSLREKGFFNESSLHDVIVSIFVIAPTRLKPLVETCFTLTTLIGSHSTWWCILFINNLSRTRGFCLGWEIPWSRFCVVIMCFISTLSARLLRIIALFSLALFAQQWPFCESNLWKENFYGCGFALKCKLMTGFWFDCLPEMCEWSHKLKV